MDSYVQALRIRNLETRLGLRQFVCATLDLQLELATTPGERSALAALWTEAQSGCRTLQVALAILKLDAEL